MELRLAEARDVASITRIYNHAIEHTTATFHTEHKTSDYWLGVLERHTDRYPFLVAVADGQVVGWGLIRPYAERPAYRYTVENAVYVDCDYQGRGIGRALLSELVTRASGLGYHAIVALVVEGNEASLRLHESAGFERVGVLREVGWKFGRWLSLVVMERLLS